MPADADPRAPLEADLLILGGTVIPMNRDMEVIADGAVAIIDGKIAALGSRDRVTGACTARQSIDATGKLVMPGLINTHTHTPMTVLRGYGDDMALDEWLNKSIWPWEHEHVNPDTVRANSRLAIIEMVRAGITTFADMYFYGTATAPLVSEIGVRAVLGEAYAEGGPYPFDHTVQATAELVERYADDPLLTVSVVAHSAYACTRERLLKCAEMAAEYGAPLHTHLSETLDETETVLAQTGMRPVAYMDSLGILTPGTVAAHCIHIDSEEMGLLAERGVSVSHTPQSEMKLASGVAPIPEMLAAGLTVGLGTDGVASNNVLDVFEEMKAAALLHKVTTGDPTALDARTVCRMATIDGARALGMGDEVGSLEPGKSADVILVDLDSPHAVPCSNPFSHAAYVLGGSDVATVIIEGRTIMLDRQLLTVDEEAAIREVQGLQGLLG